MRSSNRQLVRLTILVLALTMSACASSQTPQPAQLLSEITLTPGPQATSTVTMLPTGTATDAPGTDTPTPVPAPISLSTTDTPFPSLTPRPTRTDTLTPSATFTATITDTPTRTPRPTRTFTPSATGGTSTLICADRWFFSPRPENCPVGPYILSQALSQPFERGLMIRIDSLQVIFIMYQDSTKPRWQQVADKYAAGAPDSDPALVPPNGLQQPMRALGLAWRSVARVRQRLGWATGPETPYQGVLQIDILGNRFLRGPGREVYQLNADLSDWQTLPSGK